MSGPAVDRRSLLERYGLSESLALAAVPFAGYLTAYAYERGYLGRFGVPAWLVQVGITHILALTAVIGGVCLAWINVLSSLPRRRWMPVGAALLGPAWWLAMAYVFLARALIEDGSSARLARWFALASVALGLWSLVRDVARPILRHRDLPSWSERLQRRIGRDVEISRQSALENLLDGEAPERRLFIGSMALVAISLLPMVAFFTGQTRGALQARFWVAPEPSCVALRSYDALTVCVGLDSAGRRITRALYLLPANERGGRLESRHLGILRNPNDSAANSTKSRHESATSKERSAATRPPKQSPDTVPD